MFVRVGRYGPFLEQGERRASLRDDAPPDELTLADAAVELLDRAAIGDEPLGTDPNTDKPVLPEGRAVWSRTCSWANRTTKRKKNASLLQGHGAVEDVNLETALKLLTLPRMLGRTPGIERAGRRHSTGGTGRM